MELPETSQIDRDRAARVRVVLLAAGTLGGVALCFALALPFLGAMTSALTFAILFEPLHARIERALGRPTPAALISVLAILVIVAVPSSLVLQRLVAETVSGAYLVQRKVAAGEVQQILADYPRLAPIGQWLQEQIDVSALLSALASWLSNIGASFLRGSVAQATSVAITFYLLFYFLRDRFAIRRVILDLSPLTPTETERIFARVADTVRAIVYGTVAVAIVQGTLGGLMFWILGLAAPLFWGSVMAILSVVPVLGSFVVWIPAAILLALDGRWGEAIVLSLWGALVVGNIDNILRPMLVGNRLQLHTVPAFISMIGGLLVFGAPGFVLGPIIVTLTVLLIDIWRGRG